MKSFIAPALLFSLFLSTAKAQNTYPVPKKIPQVETRFGACISDPFKWMENHSDPDLWSWIEEEKAFTSNYLDANLSDALATRVVEIRKIREEQNRLSQESARTKSMLPSFSFEKEKSIFNVEESKKSLVKWKGRTFLKSMAFSGESTLYKLQEQSIHGGDLKRIVITQKSDNKFVDELIVKFYAFITWADDKSFYYVSDLDERIGGGKTGLFKHTVGEIQSEDQLIITGKYGHSDLTVHQVAERFFVEIDGVIGAIQLATGKVTNRLPVNGEIVDINDVPEIEVTIRSFEKANNGEFHKMRLRDGARRVFLKEQDFVLEKAFEIQYQHTLILGLKDGSHVAGIRNADGELKMLSALQDGTIDVMGFKDEVLKLGHETYSAPKKVYSYDLKSGELKLLSSQTIPVEVEAEKIYYTAPNGQKASIWVVKKKGTTLTPKLPVILYGYGGFKSSITPGFGPYESLPWIEKGGAFAVVTLPGSLDYGNSWYELARVGGRIHAWDSFALAAEALFNKGWTSKDHIGMMGASNGGTLVAGTLQRHSNKFKAAVPIVGVMDLLNFTLFTAGKYWMNDYGNPFVESDFRGIFPLSPYHNLERRDYPATMVMTAEFDDRVVPMHSYKYLARLQEFNTSGAPILLYNKEWGGHARGSGSSRESSRFVSAFYTFFAQQLGL